RAERRREVGSPGAAAQTRVVSMAGIRLGSWESARARLVSPAQASLPRSWPTPELRIPNAAAQTRIVSKARIRLDSRKSVRSFKGIICVDISEFESYMPSQPVRSPPLLAGGPPKSAQIGPIRHHLTAAIDLNAVELVQNLLEPQFVGLVHDDEKHFIVRGPAVACALRRLGGEQRGKLEVTGIMQGALGRGLGHR